MKIFEGFMYLNEKDLLILRIENGINYVEKFIIIDSDETHRGHKREPLDTTILNKYGDKVVYECISFPHNLKIDT